MSTALQSPTAVTALPNVYIDLDGTLLRTDTLWESILQLTRQKPWLLPVFLIRLFSGKASLKQWLASQVPLDVEHLPYRQPVLEFIDQQRQRGHEVVLATGAHCMLATAVARHLGCFDRVLATSGDTNLTGENKLQRILEDCDNGPFHYLGDSRQDIPIWRVAEQASFVPKASSARAARLASSRARSLSTIGNDSDLAAAGKSTTWEAPLLKALLKQMRLHQWSKNVLLFLPLILAHRFAELAVWLTASFAFLSFSCCASAGHVFNDLLDLESDRRHPEKKKRPVASGELSIARAALLAIGLFVVGVGISLATLPAWYALVVVGYTCCSLWYSLVLKEMLLIDVLVLAGFYSYRIWAGGAAVDVPISQWFVAFSGFFFLNLAFLKRYTDLVSMQGGPDTMGRRDYRADDIEIIRVMGPVSGLLSVLVMALYLNSDAVVPLYRYPERLWFMCPLMIYWIARSWILSHRGEMPSDPVGFALRDRASYLVALLSALVFTLAS